MPLFVQSREQDGWTVVALRGRIDGETAPELLAAVEEVLAAQPQQLALDLEAVDYLSSAGLRVLLRTLKAVRGWQGTLELVAPQPVVLKVLTATGFDQLLTISSGLRRAGDGP